MSRSGRGCYLDHPLWCRLCGPRPSDARIDARSKESRREVVAKVMNEARQVGEPGALRDRLESSQSPLWPPCFHCAFGATTLFLSNGWHAASSACSSSWLGSFQCWKGIRRDEQLDTAWLARLTTDQATAFELDEHAMDAGRSNPEVLLHVGFGWRPAMQLCIGVDEGEILALLLCEPRRHGIDKIAADGRVEARKEPNP